MLCGDRFFSIHYERKSSTGLLGELSGANCSSGWAFTNFVRIDLDVKPKPEGGAVILLSATLLSIIIVFRLLNPRITSLDVMRRLEGNLDEAPLNSQLPKKLKSRDGKSTAQAKCSLYFEQQNRRLRKQSYLSFVIIGLVAVTGMVFTPGIYKLALLSIGAAVAVIVKERIKENAKESYRRDLDFHLPIVMERLIMAVMAGHSIPSAIRAISSRQNQADPVSELFSRTTELTESGMKLSDALSAVAKTIDNAAVRHAFSHLAAAYRDGGTVINPLRELAESTQLYYQESIEERIAKLPAKATLPLALTFAGLLIAFVAIPLVQVTQFTSQSTEISNASKRP